MAEHSSAKIGVETATIVGMNAMIGSGIFIAPSIMAANVGPAGIIAFILVIISVWFMALSLARLAYLFPYEGSFYTYAKQWSGHIGGMLAISAYFIGLLIAMGLLSQIAGKYLFHFFPQSSANTLGLCALISLVILNMFGVVLSKFGQHVLIVATIFPLLITTVMCLTKVKLSLLTPFAPFGFGNVLKATRLVIFGFFGFECAASLFNIVENPQRNVPKALTYAIVIVGALYTAFISSIIVSTPLSMFSSPDILVPDIIKNLFPHSEWLITLLYISILSAILGTIHSMIWSSSHLLLLLMKKMKSSSAQKIRNSVLFQSPVAVLFVGSCIALSYVSLHNASLFASLTTVFIVFAFFMSMITLLTLKSEWHSGQNVKTLLGIITSLVIFAFAFEDLVLALIRV